MALIDELKKKPGMYSAANAELANAASQTAAGYQNPVVAATRAALPNAPQGAFPSPFDVGTSGQRSLVGQNIIDPIKGFFERSAAQARGDAVPSAPAKALTAGLIPAANAAAAPTQPPVSSASPDEGQRGAAANAPSGLASVPDTATTQKQALPVGYRVSDTSVSGVKRVDGGSSPMFTNIDPGQAVSEIKGMKSGTGTIGADGSNFSLSGGKLYQGRFVNSGYEGAGVAPNTDPAFREQASRDFIGYENRRWANDFNQEAQRRLADVQEYQGWAPGGPGAIAQQYRVDKNGDLQGYEIDKKGQQYAMGARQEAAQRYSDAQRGTPQSGPSLYGQDQQGKYNQSRIALDQQEAGTRALTAGINYRKSQAEMAEMERIGKLRDAYMAEPEGSPKREQIGRALLMLQGKERSQPRDEETKARYGLITELAKSYGAMPPTGPDGKPIPFDQYAATVLQMASGNRGGGGQQAPSYEQYAAQMKARNPGADDKTISQEYMKRYGG